MECSSFRVKAGSAEMQENGVIMKLVILGKNLHHSGS
jgi:hypothetical protein